MTFDTCFLIDLEREHRRHRNAGPAHQFLESARATPIYLSAVALGEFAQGYVDPASLQIGQVSAFFHLLSIGRDVAIRYSRLSRLLSSAGIPVPSNDLWIAATALEHRLPLVTRDLDHFRRIPDLQLIGY